MSYLISDNEHASRMCETEPELCKHGYGDGESCQECSDEYLRMLQEKRKAHQQAKEESRRRA